MAPRETENNAYAKFWGDKQRTLWYVMVFLEWSIDSGFDCKSHEFFVCAVNTWLSCKAGFLNCLFHSRIHSSFIRLNIYLMSSHY